MIQRRRSPDGTNLDIDHGPVRVVKMRLAGHVNVNAYPLTEARPPSRVLDGMFVETETHKERMRLLAEGRRARLKAMA